jgi:uncharacterized protein YyaL (SSP411 family)
MLAEELMHYAQRTMWDGGQGGLFDRAPDADRSSSLGLLGEPVTPFGVNCEAARVWVRLSVLAEKPEYYDRAVATLASQTSCSPDQGFLAAPYGLAVTELLAARESPEHLQP